MKARVAILTEIVAPYRTPVFNALASQPGIDLHVIYLSETDASLRQWRVDRDEIRHSHQVLESRRYRLGGLQILLTHGTRSALAGCDPDVVVAGGYNYLATWQAQRWALARPRPFLLWSESNLADTRANSWWTEVAKQRFIRRCQGYLVPGTSAAAYMKTFGVQEDRIFVAPNAVDVEHFSARAHMARQDPDLRKRLSLPSRYLLFVGRFVQAKGIFDLLNAYAMLPQEIRREVALVLAGDGRERESLIRRASQINPGAVVLPGFLQREELPAVYAFAEALVFPTHSDTWGLVVNEAMACGLPVVVTRVAGCAADMVRDGENGWVVDVRNPQALSGALQALLSEPERSRQMGRKSQELSACFTPEAWAKGTLRAVEGVLNVG